MENCLYCLIIACSWPEPPSEAGAQCCRAFERDQSPRLADPSASDGSLVAFSDKELTCNDCGLPFLFSAGEQQFFRKKGFANDPKRCKKCKAKKSMGRFPARIETAVTCAALGVSVTIPFKPTRNKPVLRNRYFRGAGKVIPFRDLAS
jgi:CxxC-x17-CxxC domain-containing protein